jgi:hypothetical protein
VEQTQANPPVVVKTRKVNPAEIPVRFLRQPFLAMAVDIDLVSTELGAGPAVFGYS